MAATACASSKGANEPSRSRFKKRVRLSPLGLKDRREDMKSSVDVDWLITLQPKSVPGHPDEEGHGGTLEILSVFADEEDAILALEFWAETMADLGYVPNSALDFQNLTPIDIRRRLGRKTFEVRCDSFEIEHDEGTTSGIGYLRAENRPRM
jgi:hypothetical protein